MRNIMRKASLLIAINILIWSMPNPVVAYTVRSEHPRVFINSDNISAIRARCTDPAGMQDAYYAQLKSYCDSTLNTTYTGSLYRRIPPFAFLYAMGELPGYSYDAIHAASGKTGIDAYAEKVKELLEYQAEKFKDANAGHYEPTIDMAVGYDWCYDYLSPSERSALVDKFILHHEKNIQSINSDPGKRTNCLNSAGLVAPGHVFLALSYYGDGAANNPSDPGKASVQDGRARDFLDEYITYWQGRIYPMWERLTKGGGIPLGPSYADMWYKYLVKGEMWNTATTDDFWRNYDGFPRNSLYFWLYNLIPYVTWLHGTESWCDEGCSGTANIGDRGALRKTGSMLTRWSDNAYPCFHSVHDYLPWASIAIRIQNDLGNTDAAQVGAWLLRYHGSTETPPDQETLSEGLWHSSEMSSYPRYLVWDLILRDEEIVARSPVELDLPTSHLFGTRRTGPPIGTDFASGSPEGMGLVTMRSAWEREDATLVFYKHTPYSAAHYHRDAGQVQIYKMGWLAIDSGQYEESVGGTSTHSNYYTRTTVSKNSLIVYDPEEQWMDDACLSSFSVCGNSGGQRDEGSAHPDSILDPTNNPEQFMGGIIAYEHRQDDYTYVASDLTRAYQSTRITTSDERPKVSEVTRQLVYLPDDFIVIFDRVTSTDATFPKRWLFHSVYRPNLDGNESFSGVIPYSTNIPGKTGGVSLRGDMNAGISESYDTDIFYVDAYNFPHEYNSPATGRAFVKTLLPAGRIHRVVGGPGYEFMDAEYNNHPVMSDSDWRSQKPEHGAWRVEVEPFGPDYPSEENNFLHVIQATLQTQSSMVPTSLVVSSAGTDMQGVYIAGEITSRLVMFSKNRELVNSVRFSLPEAAATDILLVDVIPNRTYYVVAEGREIDVDIENNGGLQKMSSENGTLYVSSGGFEYVLCNHDSDAWTHDCFVQEPDYPSKPGKGDSISDTYFNSKITRLTDTSTEVDNYDAGDGGLSLRYSSFDHENSDGTYVMVIDHSNSRGWTLYDPMTAAKIERLTDMHDGVGDGGPRWDATNPKVFYYTKYMVMYKYDLSRPKGSRISVVHDFGQDYPLGDKLDWRDEGEPSGDTRYWAMAVIWDGNEQAIVCYDRIDNRITGDLKVLPYEPDWVSMSASGDYVLVRYSYSGGKIYAYDRDNFASYTIIAEGSGHADRAKGVNGEDLVIYFDASDDNFITIADMNGKRTQLINYARQKGCSTGGHFSGNNYERPGWAVVETICTADALHTGWLDAHVFLVELKEDPTVWRICHHRSIYDSYWSNPFASINRAGTRIYFGSNWGSGTKTEMDVYKVDLPERWWEDLGGTGANRPPSAHATASPSIGQVPLSVTFTGLASDVDGSIVSYAWDFDDGEGSVLQNPVHVYNEAGDYTARLAVKDDDGGVGIDTVNIVVIAEGNQLPTASAAGSPTSGEAPLVVNFIGAGTDPDGGTVSYSWDFGDGSRSTEQDVAHTYDLVGDYNARLTVTDDESSSASDDLLIHVYTGNSALGEMWGVENPAGGSSKWEIVDEALVQSSNIYDGSTDRDVLEKLGTYALYEGAGSEEWTDYRVKVRMWSEDNDAFGVIFRYRDNNNYYRFSWDSQRGYRRLVKCENGVFSLLAEDAVSYEPGRAYEVEITARGASLEVSVDGIRILTANDSSFGSGSIAMYCWGNSGSYFDDISVREIPSGRVLFAEDFGDGDVEPPGAPKGLDIETAGQG